FEGVRHEAFDYVFKATSHHLLLASERAEWYDGEVLVDGLPRSQVRAWIRKLTFVPAGTRFYGWQKRRALSRVTFLYFNSRSSMLQSELRCAEAEFRPRLYFIIAISGRLHSSSRRRSRIQRKTKAPMSRRSVSHWHTSSCA